MIRARTAWLPAPWRGIGRIPTALPPPWQGRRGRGNFYPRGGSFRSSAPATIPINSFLLINAVPAVSRLPALGYLSFCFQIIFAHCDAIQVTRSRLIGRDHGT